MEKTIITSYNYTFCILAPRGKDTVLQLLTLTCMYFISETQTV